VEAWLRPHIHKKYFVWVRRNRNINLAEVAIVSLTIFPTLPMPAQNIMGFARPGRGRQGILFGVWGMNSSAFEKLEERGRCSPRPPSNSGHSANLFLTSAVQIQFLISLPRSGWMKKVQKQLGQ
jgi:hypothetical protein